jgi:hypothetical protein
MDKDNGEMAPMDKDNGEMAPMDENLIPIPVSALSKVKSKQVYFAYKPKLLLLSFL